jgi:hypothetical protein
MTTMKRDEEDRRRATLCTYLRALRAIARELNHFAQRNERRILAPIVEQLGVHRLVLWRVIADVESSLCDYDEKVAEAMKLLEEEHKRLSWNSDELDRFRRVPLPSRQRNRMAARSRAVQKTGEASIGSCDLRVTGVCTAGTNGEVDRYCRLDDDREFQVCGPCLEHVFVIARWFTAPERSKSQRANAMPL